MAPRVRQGNVNDKSGDAAKDVHYHCGTTQNSSAAVYSSTPASASSTSIQVPALCPASSTSLQVSALCPASSTSLQVPALCPVTPLSNNPDNNTNQLFPRSAIAKPAKPWTHFYIKARMAMEERRLSRITSTTHPRTPLRLAHRHPNPNPSHIPSRNLVKSAAVLIGQPRPMELSREIVGPQTTKHRSHECVEEGVEKNAIPAAPNFESSSSPGVLDTHLLPPSTTTKENKTSWSFDLNLPAPEQEDDEDERNPSVTLSLGLNV